MRKLTVLLLLLAALGLMMNCASMSMMGKPAPDSRLFDDSNQFLKLSDYKGQANLVLVFYWADS